MMNNTATQFNPNNSAMAVTFAPWFEQAMKQNKKVVPLPLPQTEMRVAAPILDEDYLERKENNKTPVDPLSMEEVLMLRRYFFNNTDYFKTMPTNRRNYLYTVLSLNLMRRCGDMVKLRVCDVLNEDGTFKKHVIFNHEEKTGKRATVLLNSKCQEALAEYFNFIGSYKMSDWLFPNYKVEGKHMTVDGMRKMLKRTCEKLGIEIHIGTHSLRKTVPHIAITNSTNTGDEVLVSQLLNHGSIKTTYHYIKRNQEELDSFVERNGI